MDLQTGKLYWMNNNFWRTARWVPSELIVIIDISEERDIISFYQINRGRRFNTSLFSFRVDYILSPI